MKTKEEKDKKNLFGDWINTIPVGDLPNIKARVIDECMITDQVFKHWKSGNSKVPRLAQPIINAIAGKQIFKTTEL